jgi:hypothetical protein
VTRSPPERRRDTRYRVDLPARFRIFLPAPGRPASSAFLAARVYDLSEHGVRLLSDQVQAGGLHILHPDYTTSERCLLEIEIPAEDATLVLQGKVVWYDRTPEGSDLAFQMGVEFLEVGAEVKKRIRRLFQSSRLS